MADDVIGQASHRAQAGHPAEAVALLERAGARGDAVAMAELAAWYLRGDLIPRNLSLARVALRRAVQIGHVDAALLEAALVANGSGGTTDWPHAIRLLHAAAADDPVAAAHVALLDAMELDAGGYPCRLPPCDIASQQPFVVRFTGAFSAAECHHIAATANAMLEPAVVVDPATGRSIAHPVRTSSNATLGPAHETLPIAAINRRIAAMTGTGLDQGEPLQVLRYAVGQQYKLHSDALPNVANQRIVTAIAYLNDGFVGGETTFPACDIRLRPVAGDVVVFQNTLDDGSPSPRARHAGMPVAAGVKWIATRWIRARPYDAWSTPVG